MGVVGIRHMRVRMSPRFVPVPVAVRPSRQQVVVVMSIVVRGGVLVQRCR